MVRDQPDGLVEGLADRLRPVRCRRLDDEQGVPRGRGDLAEVRLEDVQPAQHAAGGVGKLGSGLGVSALGGGTALGSLGATMLARLDAFPTRAWWAIGAAMLAGFGLTYASGFYLLSYADTARERSQLRRLIRQMMGGAALTCLATMLLTLAHAGVWWVVGSLLAGTAAINYQYLVSLQRLMAPMLARDAARHGRQGPTWIYQSTFGRPAVFWSNVFVLAVAAWTLFFTGAI